MKTKKRQSGQAATEYAICVVILVAVLFTPNPLTGGQSLVDYMIDAIKKDHEDKAWAIGHPVIGSSFLNKLPL